MDKSAIMDRQERAQKIRKLKKKKQSAIIVNKPCIGAMNFGKENNVLLKMRKIIVQKEMNIQPSETFICETIALHAESIIGTSDILIANSGASMHITLRQDFSFTYC